MTQTLERNRIRPELFVRLVGVCFFVYLFFGFMLLPCLNTLTSIFNTKNAAGERDAFAVIRFFLAGSMGKFVWNSLKLAICLVITVNIIGVSIVLLTEYFDIKGAKILRMGYMTTMIYSGVALVTGYMFLYAGDGILTTAMKNAFPDFNPSWFSGFNAVLFTMTFACTSNHMLFLRNAIRGIDYNTVEAARNMGARPFKVLWKVVFPTLIPTMFSLTVMTFITGLCAMSAPTLLGYDSINPEIVRLAGSSTADEAFPQARAALLSIILATFTIVLLTVLSAYERKGHYLSVSKTKAKLQKQKITNPVANVLAHIYAYLLFIIYMTPVVMIVVFSFQTYSAIRLKKLDLSNWTLINYFGQQDYEYLTSRGKYKTRVGSISGVFANEATLGGIRLSFILSALAAALACVIVVVLQLRLRLVCRQPEPLLRAERPLPDRHGLYGDEAALLAAHDQGELLLDRRGAGGCGQKPRRERDIHLPARQAPDHPALGAGRLRAQLQRPLYRVRHVGHLRQHLRHQLRHGHPVHVPRGGPVRLQRQRLGPPMRLHGVHHARLGPDPVSGLRRRLPRSGRAAGDPRQAAQTHGEDLRILWEEGNR